MPFVPTSPRAFVAALLPLALLHGLVLVPYAATGADPRFATPDAALSALLVRTGLDAALLVLIHLGLKAAGQSGRSAYALAGAAAAALSYTAAIASGLWPRLASEGAVVSTGLVPAVVGALSGFLYQSAAGYRWTAAPGGGDGASRPLVPTYSGPLQVRTSLAAFAIVALGPPILVATIAFLSQYGAVLAGLPRSATAWTGRSAWSGLGVPVQVGLALLPALALPTVLLIGLAHGTARWLGQTSYGAYAALGAALPIGAFTLLSGGRLIAAGMAFAVIGAPVLLTYRRLAGLEPKALPEPVLAADREALVGAGDPARHAHRIVLGR